MSKVLRSSSVVNVGVQSRLTTVAVRLRTQSELRTVRSGRARKVPRSVPRLLGR